MQHAAVEKEHQATLLARCAVGTIVCNCTASSSAAANEAAALAEPTDMEYHLWRAWREWGEWYVEILGITERRAFFRDWQSNGSQKVQPVERNFIPRKPNAPLMIGLAEPEPAPLNSGMQVRTGPPGTNMQGAPASMSSRTHYGENSPNPIRSHRSSQQCRFGWWHLSCVATRHINDGLFGLYYNTRDCAYGPHSACHHHIGPTTPLILASLQSTMPANPVSPPSPTHAHPKVAASPSF